MACPQMTEMAWIVGRWSWFPGAQIGSESILEWRVNRV